MNQWIIDGIVLTPEYRFHPTRKWRFDWAHPKRMLAIEIDGGCFVAGRHSRGAAQIADHEKMNAAALLGWTVLHVTPRQVRDGYAARLVSAALNLKTFDERPPELESRRKRLTREMVGGGRMGR